MNSGIYEIRNLLNNKVYIGSCVNFEARKKRHLRDLKSNNHHNVRLQRSYNKHGLDNFEFNIIERIQYEKDIIIERENYYINKLNSKINGYNIADASFGDNRTNHPNREEINKRTSETLIKRYELMTKEERSSKFGRHGEFNGMYGKTHTQEVRDILSKTHTGNQYNKGRIVSDETRAKLSLIASLRTGGKNSFYGKTHSEETKKKISDAKLGQKPPNRVSITVDGVHYESYGDASKALGLAVTTIRWRCLSKNVKFENYVINAERLSKRD